MAPSSRSTSSRSGAARPTAPPAGNRFRLAVTSTAIALAAAGTLTGGVVTVLAGAVDGRGRGHPPEPGASALVPTEPGAADPSRLPDAATKIVESGQVAPLRRVVPPDVLAVGRSRLPAAKVAEIGKIGRVQDVIVVAGGAVRLQGRSVQTFAVDPSEFRSWTPPGTARKNDLWSALTRDQFVVSPAAARDLRVRAGVPYPVAARSMPSVMMGGSGPLGLPGVDMLVSEKTGDDLGLIPDLVVLVNAPGADPAQVSARVTRILGGGAQVLNLHEERNQEPAEGAGDGAASSAGYLDLYRKAAGGCPGLSWTVLAAIGQVESDHGRNVGPSTAGALGPMQFLPSTWRSYGVDGDRDGKADIMNPYDAIPGAARYLCANGAGKGGQSLYQAIFQYNHAHWYVQKVLALARAYAARYR